MLRIQVCGHEPEVEARGVGALKGVDRERAHSMDGWEKGGVDLNAIAILGPSDD